MMAALLLAPLAVAAAEGAAEPTAAPAVPSLVRVGLATDLDRVDFPCCDGGLAASAGGERLAVTEGFRIEPAARVAAAGAWRLQVAALKAELQAEGLAARLAERTGEPADVVFDAGTDLYRVRVGRFATREAAEAGRRRLAQHNVHDAWVVNERGALEDPALRVVRADRTVEVPGRWLEVTRASGEGIQVGDRRVRGKVLVYLNDRGTLNLINELPFESYLRGVVPREMGPAIYDDLDALKAQTVAARTYALKNLGEFVAEGYDICATPRCQVYAGMGAEHPLSDQAVAETAGEVLLHDGQLVDAMYSSTCGGHTEDVEVVFPLKSEAYLRGVPCSESGVDRLSGDARRGRPLESELVARLLPATGAGGSPRALGARFEHLALLAGLATPEDRLRSLERREVQRFIASMFDLALDARLFVARGDLDYLLEGAPADWPEEDRVLAAYLAKSGLLAGPLDRPLDAGQIDETLYHLAVYLRVLEARHVRYLAMEEGRLVVRHEGETESHALPGRLATYRGLPGDLHAGALSLVAGDRLELHFAGDRLLAVAHEVDPDGVAYDRTSSYASWTRFRTDAELDELVRTRYPHLDFEGLEILERGVSGRVGKMRLLGAGGAAEVVEGLPVRWTLDVPDTLFTARRLTPPERPAGWLFTGRGWGHGVGMCQVGAYGMALRGHGYRSILSHYYSGVELVRLPRSD